MMLFPAFLQMKTDSDRESGDDIYGYLGAFAVFRDELVEESCILAVNECEADNKSSEDAR